MGTRNLTIIIKDNKIRLSQYGQWDGYFDYTGIRFLKFVKENLQDKSIQGHKDSMARFAEKVDLLKPTTDKYYKELVKATESYYESNDELNKSNYVIPFSLMHPQFSRDTGVEILNVINRLHRFEFNRKFFPVFIVKNEDGMCEYANVINIDTDEIYMLTIHDFKGEPQATCEVLENFDTGGMRCYFKSNIQSIPSIRACKKLVSEIGID